ncbi:hypothetical protein CVT24_012473, partial [Panaeolus cyanescens]
MPTRSFRGKNAAQKIINQKVKNELMRQALAEYQAEKDLPVNSRRGLRTVCNNVSTAYFEKTGTWVNLSHATLARWDEGGQTREDAAAERAWLSPAEEEVVVDFVLDMASRGFPLSHRRVKDHVDSICEVKYSGPNAIKDFPRTGVGKGWTARFMLRHADRLRMARSSPLEVKRSRAVNSHANDIWWEILGSTISEYDIKPHNIYGADECGVLMRGLEREHVFAERGKPGLVYQQRAGSRENTTALVTICADGTSIRPTIIFKGKHYQVKWAENNPLNASIGYSEKGWTNGEIGAVWMEHFDEQTKHKLTSDDEYRLLLVDGHNSHHTLDFLLYAKEHKIIVLCYVAHGTHVYQGLDVVVFSPLKHYLMQARDEHY